MIERTYDRGISVDDSQVDCALEIKVWDHDKPGAVAKAIRIPVEDVADFMRQVVNHGGNALMTAARRIEVGHCETCGNTGLVYEKRPGAEREWSVDCPDCKDRWPSKPLANAPTIGKRNTT